MADDLWRNFVNSIPEDKFLEETETPAPDIESIEHDTGEDKVILQRIVTEVWAFTHIATGKMWYGTAGLQDLHVFEEMTLNEAKQYIAKRRRRRKK